MPRAVSASDSGPSIDFYVAKFVVTTTSDWTSVRVANGAVVATVKLEITKGKGAPALNFGSDPGRDTIVSINKKQYDTTLVQIEVLATLTNLPNNTDLIGVIEKGAVGHTLVAVFNQNRENAVAVSSFNDVIHSSERNAYRFSFHTKDLMAGGPRSVPTHSSPKLVLAFYYPWYSFSDWAPPKMKDLPLSGAYSSDQDATITRHINVAKSAGIDGFIVSWWGISSDTDGTFRRILARAEELHFLVTIYHEYSDDHRRTRSSYFDDIRYLLDNYAKSSSFLKLDGKPVIFTYTANAMSVEDYQSVRSDLEQHGYDFVNIGDTLDTKYLGVFDGLHTYATNLGDADLSSAYRSVSLATKSFSIVNNGASRKIWAATICPGWDLRSIPSGGPDLFQLRGEAEYFNGTFKVAMASDPDWVLITSFNEWWENTEIEPSKTYGYRYIDATTDYDSEFKQTRYLPLLQVSRTVIVEGQAAELHVTMANIGNGSAISVNTQDATSIGGENTTRVIDRLLPNEGTNYTIDFNISSDQVTLRIPQGEVRLKDAYGLGHTKATDLILKHRLSVASSYGLASGSGWYDADTVAAFSVSPTSVRVDGVLGILGTSYVFERWSGDQSTTSPDATVVMDGPKAVTAQWRTDYTSLYIIMGAIAAVIVAAVYIRRKSRRT